MDTDRIFTRLEKPVSILHTALLFLSALTFAFVFVINWEDWFFGIQLAGPAAGVFLAAEAAGAVVLLYAVTHYPGRWRAVLPASIAYFGFVFINAVVTCRTTAPGSFPALLALPVLIPVLHLVLRLRSSRSGKKQDQGLPEPGDNDSRPLPDTNLPLLLLGGAMVLMVFMILIVPLGTALIVTSVPSLHRMSLPPAHDTILFKVNRSGNPEWETAVPGYSLDFVRLADGENGSFLLYGTYFVSGRDDAQIRVLKIDREGNRIWDMTRGMRYGILPGDTAQIESVDASGPGATVWLTNGMSLWIDGGGNVTDGSLPAKTIPQPAAEIREPAGFSTGRLPAKSVLIRIQSGGEPGLLFPVEDTLTRQEIRSVYSVNPAADGGYLVSASVRS